MSSPGPTAPSLRALLAIAALALCVRLFALWAIPFASQPGDPNFAPDEQGHLAVESALAHGHRLHWPEASPTIYAVFPVSQDLLQAATLALGGRLGLAELVERSPPLVPEGRGYPWARLGSALASVFTCLFLACAVGRFSRDPRAGALAGFACALHPQLAFLGAYANPDVTAICAGSALAAALARWYALGESKRGLLRVGLAAGFVLAEKASGFFILVPTALWVAAALWKRRLRWRDIVPALAAALAVCAPALWSNGRQYPGDFFGLAAYQRYLAEGLHPRVWSQVPDAARQLLTLLPASAFGLFGNMSLPLPRWQLVAYAVVLGVGALCAIRSWPGLTREQRRPVLWMGGAWIVNLGVELHHLYAVDFQPQGRYLLLSSLGLLFVALLAPPSQSPKLRRSPEAILALLCICTLTMEWMLCVRGR